MGEGDVGDVLAGTHAFAVCGKHAKDMLAYTYNTCAYTHNTPADLHACMHACTHTEHTRACTWMAAAAHTHPHTHTHRRSREGQARGMLPGRTQECQISDRTVSRRAFSCTHTHTHTCTHTHMHTHMHTHNTRTHTRTHVHVCTRPCTCARAFMCMCCV
jgi:hypothetical protein